MATHYSQYFKLKHKDFINRGVYNGFLDKDSDNIGDLVPP